MVKEMHRDKVFKPMNKTGRPCISYAMPENPNNVSDKSTATSNRQCGFAGTTALKTLKL